MHAGAPEDADLRSGKGMGDENFPVGSFLLAPHLRRHVHAYYDFVRAADDVSDSPTLSPDEKIRRLDAMEAALLGRPGARSTSAGPLRATFAETGLPATLATDLLVAFRRDARTTRTADWAALLDYCRHSANPVGRFLLALHGESAATHAPSDALCTSLQILNHLQDCAEDLRALDRSYLPADMLAAEGIDAAAVSAPHASAALRRVFDRILDRVDALNAEAATLPALVRDRRMRLEAAVIVGLARRLTRRLRREDPVAGRVKLGRDDVAAAAVGALRHLRAKRTALGLEAADLAAVEAIVRRAGTSFGAGMRILPPDRRAAMHAIYAFCRIVDDIADDEAEPLEGRRAALEAWRRRLERLYAGTCEDALDRALLAAIRRYDLRQADFVAVVDGMETDAATTVVAPRLADLDLYCDRVASAVGRLSVRAFGDASPAADEVAHHLGRALQLTNILRDLEEDHARGRLYLPREFLAAEGVPLAPGAALAHPGLRRVAARVAARARGHFAAAEDAMRRCDARAMTPARIMGATYAALLARIDGPGWTPGERVGLARRRKVAIAAATLLRRGA